MSRSRLRPYAVALGLLWGLPLVLVVGLHLTLPRTNPGGQCEGIGFGCTLPAADAVLLLGMLAAPVLLLVGLVTCIAIAVVTSRRERRDRREPPEDARP
jgi:hypothetical protein